MFLTVTVKAYSCRNQTKNNQYKRHSAVWERLCRLMVWCEIHSQLYSFLFKNNTGSKGVQLILLLMIIYGALVTLEDSLFGPGKISKIPMSFLLSVKLPFSPVYAGNKNDFLLFLSLCSWVNVIQRAAYRKLLIWKPDRENILYAFQWLVILWFYENILLQNYNYDKFRFYY